MTTPVHTTTEGAWLARRARPLLVVYAVLLAVALLAPTSTVQSGMVKALVRAFDLVAPVTWVDFTRAEVIMNAVIIAPVSFLGSWVLPRLQWQDWTAYGFLGSVLVELAQSLVLSQRQPSFSDVVANTAGALAGGLLARLVVLALASRARRRAREGDVPPS